jgi:hypothetical protein
MAISSMKATAHSQETRETLAVRAAKILLVLILMI